jgi:hypothetical protein
VIPGGELREQTKRDPTYRSSPGSRPGITVQFRQPPPGESRTNHLATSTNRGFQPVQQWFAEKKAAGSHDLPELKEVHTRRQSRGTI